MDKGSNHMTRDQVVASAVQVRRMLHQRRSCAISSEVQDGKKRHDVSKGKAHLCLLLASILCQLVVSEQVSMRDETL